jgi:MFS family permease
VWPLLAGAAVLGVGFALAELRSAEPLLPVRLLRGPLGNAALLTMTGQMLSIVVGFHLPHYLEDVLHFDPARSGRTLAVLPLVALVAAPLAGQLADRIGPRQVATAGLLIAAIGFWMLAGLGITLEPARLYGAMALVGIGLGLFSVPNASAVMSAVPRPQLGIASGLQATMRNLGIAGGAAGMAALIASRYAAHGGGPLRMAGGAEFSPLAFTEATRDAYRAVLGLALISVALSWPRRHATVDSQPGPEGSG